MAETLSWQAIADDAFAEKYARPGETRPQQRRRVAEALASVETEAGWADRFEEALERGFVPGGRIQSGAGTGLKVTLINCFVQPVGDSMSEISHALSQAMLTLKQGGGVGYDFSPIRPKGAIVRAVNAEASGPISFMRVFDKACETIESAGYRRGAQMGVLRVDHPDIRDFVTAKQTAGELTNFNVSVGATDEFMAAVADDREFDLVHEAEPCDRLKESTAFYDETRGRWVYERIRARDLWDLVMEQTYDHAEPGVLFVDRVNGENNLWYAETIRASNPCAEQMLPSYGCCCLGSIDLTRFVEAPFSQQARFDEQSFVEIIATATRMLDNVLDVTAWPLPDQDREAANKRRIGLGYLGLGDALIMLGVRYDSEEGRAVARRITRIMRDAAYRTSIELAEEKGAFPLLDVDKHLQGAFIQRLPDDVQNGIRAHGIRNSHLLSIAPTGTIALAFADNASNGIEPPFSWSYVRKKRMPDNSTQEFEVLDYAFRVWRDGLGNDPGEHFEHLPSQFVSALQMPVREHKAMLEAVQPFIDSAISKTCNVPVDYDYTDFCDLYSEAWRAGLKGLTTFRPNMVTGSVLSTESSQTTPEDFDESDANRRITLESPPRPALELIRWPSRPKLAGGNPAMTYMVEHPDGKFAVFVGHLENGHSKPFEVWVNGAEQPRGLGAIAKALSMDMRVDDPQWLAAKLASLAKVHDQPFAMTLPDGTPAQMPSTVAAFARLVEHRAHELGALDDSGETPMMDSLMSRKEPKTGPNGTMSWTVDVYNPATGDDFVLGLKELTVEGARRPYSIWLAGDYPRALDGLCKVLSYDMRVIDPAWIGAKLRTLVDFPETQGDFLAWVPGENRQATQPSTIAYIAKLVMHRYQMLGILDGDGYPVEPMGVVEAQPQPANEEIGPPLAAVGAMEVMAGSRCQECGNYAVIKRDGCDFCSACGAMGGCG